MADFPRFCINFIRITDNENKLIRFDLNDAQRDLYKLIKNNKHIVVSKARQNGTTTMLLAYAVWRAVRNKNERIIIVSYKQDSATDLFNKLKMMNEYLPRKKYVGLFTATKRSNRDELVFANGSRITSATAGNKDLGRGSTYTMILMSEIAFYADIKDQLVSAEQSLAKGSESRMFLESTSNGLNEYYEIVKNAAKGNSKYKLFFIPWTHKLYLKQFAGEFDEAEKWYRETNHGRRLDRHDLLTSEKPLYKAAGNYRYIMWRRWKMLDLGEDAFKQEFPSNWMESFITSNKNVFDAEKILNRLNYVMPPMSSEEAKAALPEKLKRYITRKNLYIYHLPKQGQRYFAGVDVSSGSGSDYSTMTIISAEGEEAATFFSNKVPVYEYAAIIDELGKFYNYAFICVERNSFGTPLLERLRKERNYLNLYKQKSFDEHGKRQFKLGWQLLPANKPTLITDFKEAFERGLMLIHTKELLQEMQIYQDTAGRMGNKQGKDNHDDLIYSAAYAWQAEKTGKWYV
jgi:hypothetical protein